MNGKGPVFDTFFDCISYAQCGRTSACDIQRACLDLFAAQVFGNKVTCSAVLQNPDAFCVRPDAMEHLAVRLWYTRLKHGSVKKLACRFLAYHCKPKRLMCQYTFAALVNETNGITVSFAADEEINVSVPEEYFIDGDDATAITHVTLHKNAQAQWIVMDLQTRRDVQEQEVTLRVIPVKQREEFCVRAAFEVDNTLRKNIRVGDMVSLGDCVYRFDIIQWNERATYQIYPASEKSTYYWPLPSNVVLYLFVCSGNSSQSLAVAASTTSHDIYLYYKPVSKEMNTLLVVKATSEEIATRLVRSALALK